MVFKIGHVILLASVKYILTLPYAMIIGLEYKQAILSVLIGGIGGFLFFYYLSKPIARSFNNTLPYVCRFIPAYIKIRFKTYCVERFRNKPKKMFTRKSRFLAKFRSTYGFWGIIITTPLFLTIPVGAFLANKYYSKRKQTVPFMILSIIGWAAVLSGLVHIFPKVFF
ncbi:MAG: hypothetical protein R2757_03865 [Draconibacterium sp.]